MDEPARRADRQKRGIALSRRRVLGAAAMGTFAAAGCLGLADDGGPGNGDENDPSDLKDASIETTGTGCGSADDEAVDDAIADVTDDETDVIVVTGTLPAPNPCHEATLEDATLEDGRLSLVVDVEDATDEDEGCMQCLGAVGYEVRAEVTDGAAVERVDVEHVTGEEHEVDLDGDDGNGGDDGEPTVDSTAIETTDASCGSADDEAVDVDATDGTVVVTGALPAPNPCHEAALEDVSIEDATLSVVVDVRSTLDGDEGCIECIGSVAYEATIEVSNVTALDAVRVEHVTGDEHTVTPDETNGEQD